MAKVDALRVAILALNGVVFPDLFTEQDQGRVDGAYEETIDMLRTMRNAQTEEN